MTEKCPLGCQSRLLAWFSRTITFFALLSLAVGHAVADPVTGRFDLIDHSGKPVSEASYGDKLRMVFFGFTSCPVVCPTTMAEISRAMRMLGSRAKDVQPLFITIDPQHDGVEVVAAYVEAFGSTVVGLTGSEEQISRAAEAFNVTYGRREVAGTGGQEEIYHSAYVYLIGREGELLDLIGYGTRAEVMVEKLHEYL